MAISFNGSKVHRAFFDNTVGSPQEAFIIEFNGESVWAADKQLNVVWDSSKVTSVIVYRNASYDPDAEIGSVNASGSSGNTHYYPCYCGDTIEIVVYPSSGHTVISGDGTFQLDVNNSGAQTRTIVIS